MASIGRFLLVGALAGCPAPPSDSEAEDTGAVVGLYLRLTPEVCDASRTPRTPEPEISAAGGTCIIHSDCQAGAGGRCVVGTGGQRQCVYDECESDSDCGSGFACSCGEVAPNPDYPVNRCVEARCHSGLDCASGLCMGTGDVCIIGDLQAQSFLIAGYYCATDQDACRSSDACGWPSEARACLWSESDALWSCQDASSLSCPE